MVYEKKPWLKSYDADVNAEIPIPDFSLKDYLLQSFQAHKDRTALHYLGASLTFGQLMELSGRFAAYLKAKGLGKGDVVAVNLPNTPQYLVTIVGALRAGCAISGLAPLLMPDEMVYQLNDCGAKVLVTLDVLFDAKFAAVADQAAGVKEVLVTGVFDPLPSVTQYPAGKPLAGKSVAAFYDVLKQYPDEPPDVTLNKDDPCYLQYTGGTTGPPKGAVLSHGNMVANVYQFEDWMKMERGKEVWVSGFPIFHQAGLFVTTCAMAWAATQCLIPDPRNVEHIVKECDTHKPTFMINVPSLFLMLMANENFKKLDFSNLRYCMSGAAPFPVEGIRALEAIVGPNKMVEVWGMTETSPLITVNPGRGKKKIGAVGVPLPNTEFKIVSLNDGETEVPMGEEGELICHGPQVMMGYLNKPKETQNALRIHDGKKWMHTGDVGRMDEDGFVYVVDRAKDMLIVGGFKVFSSEVEDKLYRHPAISMCALIGLPNPDRPDSEIVKLFVQKSPAYKDKPEDDIRAELFAFAKEKLAPYKVPKIIEFVSAIPMTSVGKVDKKSLRKR
jgi:acyl-CoA synthetase (AMP-forming)/AMP-acid ligase II